jgi:hypothetical protein
MWRREMPDEADERFEPSHLGTTPIGSLDSMSDRSAKKASWTQPRAEIVRDSVDSIT